MPFTRLRLQGRNHLQVTHVTSPSNSTLIPAAGATIDVFRSGATATQEVELLEQSTEVIPVIDSGEIVAGDALFIESTMDDQAEWLYVAAVAANRKSITVQYAGYRLVISPGMRMTPAGSRPCVYPEPAPSMAGSPLTTDSQGQVQFALAQPGAMVAPSGFDFTVHYPTATGWSPQHFVQPAGLAVKREPYVDASDFSSLQDAIQATAPGGRLYMPAGTYVAPPGGFVVDKSIEMFGEGGSSTVLKPNSSAKTGEPVLKFVAASPVIWSIHLHDFAVRGDGPGAPTQRYAGSHGISFIVPDTNHQFTEIRLERIYAAALGDDGFHIEGHDIGSGAIVFVYGVALEAIECWGSGFYIRNSTVVEMHNCYANGNRLFGGYAKDSQVAWFSCAFENNCRFVGSAPVVPGGADTLVYDTTWGAQLRLNSCHPGRIDACDFESFGITTAEPNRTVRTAVILENCNGALVTNSAFYNPTRGTAPNMTMDSTCKGIVIPSGDGSPQFPSDGWATVMPCIFSNVGVPITVGDHATAVSVHTQRIVKDPLAAGAIDFKPPGIALPTIEVATDLRSWTTHSAGHLLFDATPGVNKLKCWDGTAWRTIAWGA